MPRVRVTHRGVELTDLDLDAVLARRPDVALVDELAHTNAPGLDHEKRWQDVDRLLDAGIDVISTVNIQHIESLNDVVEKITGAVQRETIPDAVLRGADQIEVVDLAPQALRDRLAGGYVYPAERVDAALSNYFRLGNLTALRELALLWLADEVDAALQLYRTEHGIDSTWEARERVVVTLTGGPEETLVRRAPGSPRARRAASSSRCTSRRRTACATRPPARSRTSARSSSSSAGRTTRWWATTSPPRSSSSPRVSTPRSSSSGCRAGAGSRRPSAVRASGRRSRARRATSTSTSSTTPPPGRGAPAPLGRRAHPAASRRGVRPRPRRGPLLTWLLVTARDEDTLVTDVLAYQLLVVVVALVGASGPRSTPRSCRASRSTTSSSSPCTRSPWASGSTSWPSSCTSSSPCS